MIEEFNELNKKIANAIISCIDGRYHNAILKLELSPNSVTLNGSFSNVFNLRKSLEVSKIDSLLKLEILDFYEASNRSNQFKWNKAIFSLNNKGQYEMKFEWDKELADELGHVVEYNDQGNDII